MKRKERKAAQRAYPNTRTIRAHTYTHTHKRVQMRALRLRPHTGWGGDAPVFECVRVVVCILPSPSSRRASVSLLCLSRGAPAAGVTQLVRYLFLLPRFLFVCLRACVCVGVGLPLDVCVCVCGASPFCLSCASSPLLPRFSPHFDVAAPFLCVPVCASVCD